MVQISQYCSKRKKKKKKIRIGEDNHGRKPMAMLLRRVAVGITKPNVSPVNGRFLLRNTAVFLSPRRHCLFRMTDFTLLCPNFPLVFYGRSLLRAAPRRRKGRLELL